MATDANDGYEILLQAEEVSPELVERLYRRQVLARTFDEKAVSLHRQGRIGTYAPLAGQEAAQVGAAAATTASDWLFPTYRDHAMYMTRGFEPEDVLLHHRGQGNYVDDADPATVRTFPPTIPIATQLPHAVGVGMASTYDAEGRMSVHGDDPGAVLASFGDGATSEGDFHEAMNFAGVFDAPVVFLCQNNRYAISTPVDRQTASATIAQKADAYGFDGIRVDGDDVLAVYDAVTGALETARDDGGPTLIEAVTYRDGAHTTTDDPSVYRGEEAPDDHVDPLERTRQHLRKLANWSPEEEAAVQDWAAGRVADAVETVAAHPEPNPEQLFENVYAQLPDRVARQRAQVHAEPEVDR
jgi:pyruvate dehydrogenase E1 component alpha subunit